MVQLTVKAPAKINLSLDVTGKRPDGYHLLSTVMQSLELHDLVTVSLDPGRKGIRLSCGKAPIPSDSRNTAWRAAALFAEAASLADGISISIEKHIPAAAGMAGGSSDAAAVLFALSRLVPGQLTRARLFEMAGQIGADVPFCLQGGTVLCEGIGEILTPLQAWADVPVLLVKPSFGMSTPWVFSRFRIDQPGRRPDQPAVLAAIGQHDLQVLAVAASNVLESVSLNERPLLAEIKSLMKRQGAALSLMSGSGPTVFGLFADEAACRDACQALTGQLPADTMILMTRTSAVGPAIT